MADPVVRVSSASRGPCAYLNTPSELALLGNEVTVYRLTCISKSELLTGKICSASAQIGNGKLNSDFEARCRTVGPPE